MRAVEGSAGRIPSFVNQRIRSSSAFTFSEALRTGFGPGSKTRPPKAFWSAAW